MFVLLDSADRAQVDYWLDCGVIDGVTTNPLIMAREGVSYDHKTLVGLAEAIAPRPLHLEVTAPGGDELLAQAHLLSGLAANVVVKVPVITPGGEPCLPAINALHGAGVRVNATACLSMGQAVLAAKAGAEFVSIFVGRIDDEGGDGAEVVASTRRWLDRWGLDTRIISASLRGTADVRRSWEAGTDCVTVPPAVLSRLCDHKYGRHTVGEFVDAASAIGGVQN